MPRFCLWLVIACCVASAAGVDSRAARGQQPPRRYPVGEYYLALELYRAGDLGSAIEGFETALRSGRKDPSGLWIDSIPTHALLGECHYQSGNLPLAHEHFDAAILLMLKYDGWLNRLNWPAGLTPAGGVRTAGGWAPAAQRAPPAAVPDVVPLMIGTLDASSALQQGGPFVSPQLMRVDVAEILRGLALALYRRAEVLGPLAADGPPLERLIASLRQTELGAGAWPRPWIELTTAMAMLADDRPEEAMPLLAGSLQLQGQFDHPLASLGYVALGRLMQRAGRVDEGEAMLISGSVSAAVWEQGEMVAEAFRQATGPAAADGRTGLYRTATAAATEMARRSRLASAACLVSAAELAASAGRADEAGRRLQDLGRLTSRRSVFLPRLEAQTAYVRALMAASAGDAAAAASAAEVAIAFGTGHNGALAAPRLYQIARVQAAIASGEIGARSGDELLGRMLRRPDEAMWRGDAVEALAVEGADLSDAHAMHLELAAERSRPEEFVVRLDRLMRHRFRQIQPLGARPLDARWTVAAPPDWLTGEAAALRQALPGRFAELDQRAADAAGLRDRLAELPPDGDDAVRREAEAGLRAASERLEALVHEIALRRQPLATAFPPPLEASAWERRIPDDGAVLAYAPVGDRLLGIVLTRRGVRTWIVEEARSLPARTGRLLSEIGVGRRRGGAARIGDSEDWEAMAASLGGDLLPAAEEGTLEEVRRLVVVPAGVLWQLPFELLPAPGGGMWVDRFALSYAPTLGLALQPPPARPADGRVAGVSNRFFAPKQPELDAELVEQVLEAVPDSLLLSGGQAVAGRWLAPRMSAIWVANASRPDPGAPLAWSPLGYDARAAGGSLADWIRFPHGAPRVVALPGVELGGQSPFPLACGLQAAGVPMAVLSRWPVAGASTAELLAEFVRELPHGQASDAWRRAVLLLRNRELDPEMEPVLSSGDVKGGAIEGASPLFWAGYIPIGGLGT